MAASSTFPRRAPSKRGFFRGGAGAVIVCVGSFIMMAALLFYMLLWSNYSSVYFFILVGSIILWFGCAIQGMGFEGFFKNYGLSMGRVAGIFSLVVPIILLLTTYWGMAPRSYYYWSYSSPSNLPLFWGGLVVFGVMAILWGVACIQARKFVRSPDTLLAAGVINIVAGGLIASLLLAFIGFILLFVSGIMTAAVFLRYGVTDLVFSYIFLQRGTIEKSKCAKELGLTAEEVDRAINVLVREGRIER